MILCWSFGKGDARETEFKKNVQNFKNEIKRIVEAHIEKKNAGDYDTAPFLDALIDNIDDKDEIIHQAITFMIGGFHTSGTMMTWFFYNLGLHPEIQKRVHDEIKKNLNGKGLEAMEDIDKLPYTKQVLDETLRHVKLAPFSERQVEKDVEIDGYVIKKGSQILNSLCLTLDDRKVFPNPDNFDPGNFDDGKSKGLAFSPFGFGVRKCPGYR
jgi:cytochrome P450 family 20 subfamily A